MSGAVLASSAVSWNVWPLTATCDLKGGRSRFLHWYSSEQWTIGLHIANLIIVVTNPGAQRRSLLSTIPRILTLFAIIVAPCYWSTCSLMHLPMLSMSATPMALRSWISGLELLRCWLILNCSLPLLCCMGLNLNMSLLSEWLHLGEGMVLLYRHKLTDLYLEHVQVAVHLNLLQSNILREEKGIFL